MRGRPKGRSKDKRSFGPLGDLIRKHRLDQRLGLADVANKCNCSVQFISNIEHGRAPLPWEKAVDLAKVLGIPLEELRMANLAMRADFKSFVAASQGGKRVSKPLVLSQISGTATAVAIASQDLDLQKVILKYQTAPQASRKRFVREALSLLKV
jgi:transcriptional regulator with XRE-family HTH domain